VRSVLISKIKFITAYFKILVFSFFRGMNKFLKILGQNSARINKYKNIYKN
jgi:hypothetical protein